MPNHYTRPMLMDMKVSEIKALIREHNLHNAIKGYSKMKKGEMVDAFLKFHNKPKSKSSKPKGKLSKLEKDLGIGQPLYKEGLVKGAKKQFEKGYGKRHTNKQKQAATGLKILEAQREAEGLGRGKRQIKPPARFRK